MRRTRVSANIELKPAINTNSNSFPDRWLDSALFLWLLQRPLRPVFVSKMARAIYRSQSIDDFMKERNDRIVSRIVTRKIYPVKTFQGGTSPLKTGLRVYHEVFLHRAFDFLSLEIQPEACASPADDIARISKRVPEAQLPYNSSASLFLNMPQSRR